MKKNKKYILVGILVVLSIMFITVSASAENNTAGNENEIADEKTLVRMTASFSRGRNEDDIVDKDTLAEELDKYIGTGVTTVSELSSDTLLVTFLETGRKYEVNRNTGEISEDLYSIIYDANGGTGAPATQEKHHGINITLTTTEPTREGHTFLGWSTNSTDIEPSYLPGATFSINANTTLYAIWEANTYTVTYNANGGIGENKSVTQVYGTSITLYDENTFTAPTGKHFVSWNTSADGTGDSYSAGETYTEFTDMSLYAIWAGNEYTITYDANGGTNAPSATRYTYETSGTVSLSTSTPTWEGHTFNGWGTSSTDTTVDYVAGAEFSKSVASNTTLYAIWTTHIYTVTYDANGGTNAPSAQTKTYGVDLTLTTTEPTREGHTFLGWSTNSTDIEPSYLSGATFSVNANTTLYAIWKINSYTVTYNANGGTGANKSVTKTYGTSMTLYDENTFTAPTGKHFVSWNTSADGTGDSYSAGETYTEFTDMSLYAIWAGNEYTITYDANGGTNAPSATRYTYATSGTVSLSTSKPTREGYTFKGWGTSSTDTTVDYAAGAEFSKSVASNTTLYAIWEINSYTVTYNANGGTGANKSVTKTYGSDMILYDEDTFTAPTGKHFVSWNTSADGTGDSYSAGETYTEYTNMSLYAIWETHTDSCYTITYHSHTGDEVDGGGCYGTANYHYHTGSATSGGGCYTWEIYHEHDDSCFEENDYMDVALTDTEYGGCPWCGDDLEFYAFECSWCGWIPSSWQACVNSDACGYTTQENAGYLPCYHEEQVCDYSDDEIIGYELDCGYEDGELDYYSLNCGKTTSTVESKVLNCGGSE